MADEKYDTILRTAITAAAASGPLAMSPIPGTDTLVMGGTWIAMMTAIAKKAGYNNLDSEIAKKVVLGVVAGAGAYWTGSKIFTWILAKIPVIGWVTGSGINATLNVLFTLWMGYAFIDWFEGPNIEFNDLSTTIKQLIDAMQPGLRSGKIQRIADFFTRIRHDLVAA